MIEIKCYCIVCGKEFVPKFSTQITCSGECSERRKKDTSLLKMRAKKRGERHSIVCAQCGNEFVPTHGHQKYCSNECKGEAMRQSRKRADEKKRDRDRPPWQMTYPKIRQCVFCGKHFETETFNKKYCSKQCRFDQAKLIKLNGLKMDLREEAEDPAFAAAADEIEKEIEKLKKQKAENERAGRQKLEELAREYEGGYIPEEHAHEDPGAYARRQEAKSVEQFARVELPEWAKRRTNGKRNEGEAKSEEEAHGDKGGRPSEST